MGKPILYCSDCGVNLREEDFDRGRAGRHLFRPYCTTCRPDLKPVTPRSVPRAPNDRTPAPSSSISSISSRSRIALARPPSRAVPLVVAAISGGLLMIALVASLPPAKPPARPPLPLAANQPGSFAAAPKRPEPPPAPPAPSLDRWLDEIRTIRKNDPDFRRAGELRSMLRKAVDIAGPRRAEIDALLAAYETELAKPPPKPKGAVIASCTLINADTDKPVPGFDPLPPDAVVDLGKLRLKKIDVRFNTSPAAVGSLEMTLNGGTARSENSLPYSCTNNSIADGFDGWIPAPGRQTIKARIWSVKDRKGEAGPWTTFAFTVVDPR